MFPDLIVDTEATSRPFLHFSLIMQQERCWAPPHPFCTLEVTYFWTKLVVHLFIGEKSWFSFLLDTRLKCCCKFTIIIFVFTNTGSVEATVLLIGFNLELFLACSFFCVCMRVGVCDVAFPFQWKKSAANASPVWEVRCRIPEVWFSLADKGAFTEGPKHVDAHVSFLLLDAELVIDRIDVGCRWKLRSNFRSDMR